MRMPIRPAAQPGKRQGDHRHSRSLAAAQSRQQRRGDQAKQKAPGLAITERWRVQ
jgi:hypothetical protein